MPAMAVRARHRTKPEVQNNAYSMHPRCQKEKAHGVLPWACGKSGYLAITRHSAEFAGQEVVRGPGAADCNLTVLELLSSRVIAVLVLFHALAVDQVGNVDQHALRSNLLAADFFFQRVKELVDLHRQGACLGLAFPLAGGLYPKL